MRTGYAVVLTGVGTKIDPTLCRADRMVGQVLGAVDALPDIYTELTISFFLLRRLLGVKTEGDKRGAKVNFTYCSTTEAIYKILIKKRAPTDLLLRSKPQSLW